MTQGGIQPSAQLWDRPAVPRLFPYRSGRRVAGWRGVRWETIGKLLTEGGLDSVGLATEGTESTEGIHRGDAEGAEASFAYCAFCLISGRAHARGEKGLVDAHANIRLGRGFVSMSRMHSHAERGNENIL